MDDLFRSNQEEKLRILSVPLTAIAADPEQPRTVFSDESIDDLAASLNQDGLIQPIEVVQIGRNQYRIIHGERRWRAASSLNWESIPAIVRQNEYDKVTKFVRQLVENIQREDLNDVDRAAGLIRLKEMMTVESSAEAADKKTWRKTTWADVAGRIGFTRQRVNQLTRLLKLPDEIQQSIIDGLLSERDTRVFHGLTPRQQRALHRARIVNGSLSQAETVRVAKFIKANPTENVTEAIQVIRQGDDLVAKNKREVTHAKNLRETRKIHKSLIEIEVGKGRSADTKQLLQELTSIRATVDDLLKQLKKSKA